ncbi:DUF4474 domain-containing protein [Lachnospiraceae bacterium 29-84]
MHFKWICFAVCVAIVALLVLFCCWRCYCRRKARRLVREQRDYIKIREINQALEPFGFAYYAGKDIFCSLEDAWQRDFGYGKIYDTMAPFMNMEIDCEPIYFRYGGKRWLVEFWKGQYGITTGAEIGIYWHEGGDYEIPPEELFYHCVPQEQEIPMRMALYKNGKLLFGRNQKHWWLTGFVLGEFSYPGELMLEASITLEEPGMLEAFLEGCYNAGYRQEDLHVRCNTVSFCFYHPKQEQSICCCRLYQRYIQWQNRHNCKLYDRVSRSFTRTVDKLYYLMKAYPRIFALLTKTGRAALGKKGKRIALERPVNLRTWNNR